MKNLLNISRDVSLKLLDFWRTLWVRVVLMGVFALLALGVASLVDNGVSSEWGGTLTGEAVDRLLDIIANAMLAVTIFSITVMVSVYRASSAQWTPRIHRLIIHDPTTQNTLATFIGTYVYALVAIILRETGVFPDDQALVLFCTTVLVLVFIVFSLIRWVMHLQTMGSLLHTTREVEDMTRRQFEMRLDAPCLGGRVLKGEIPEEAVAVPAGESGYVTRILPAMLQEIAEDNDLKIYLPNVVGSFVFLNAPLCHVVGAAPEEELAQKLRAGIELGDVRQYEQDPRFGLTVLGEMGSKALSPGINDPGTAIDVITRVGRILSLYRNEAESDEREADFDRLFLPPLSPEDLIDDGLGALARDGAALLEVQITLQKILAGLMRHPEKGMQAAARKAAEMFLDRARQEMTFDEDIKRVEAAADSSVLEE